MNKIVLGGLLVVALVGCGGGDKAPATENAKSVSQQLVPTAPGWISAFAGAGVRGYSASGTASLFTQLDSPSGLALCPDGALYVSDTGNNRIVKFKDGTMTVVVAGQTTSTGLPYRNLLLNPRAEDPMPAFGSGVSDSVGFPPGWTTILPSYDWLEVDGGNGRPESLDGEKYFMSDGAPGAIAEMDQDVDVSAYTTSYYFTFYGFVRSLRTDTYSDAAQIKIEARDSRGAILEAYDSGPQTNVGEWRLIKYTLSGSHNLKTIRVRLISTRNGNANDAYYDGLMLRAEPFGDNVSIFNGDTFSAQYATLAAPHGLACDSDGTLYIADTYANRIRAVSPSGTISTVAGGCGLNQIGIDPLSQVPCVSSADNDYASALNVQLSLPMSVSINHANGSTSWMKLVIADFLNHRVRALTTDSNLETILKGNGAPCHPLNGTIESEYCTYYPMGVDAVGNTVRSDGNDDLWPGITIANRGDNNILSALATGPSTPLGDARPITAGVGLSDALQPDWTRGYDFFGGTYTPVAVTSVAADPGTTPLNPGLARGHFWGPWGSRGVDDELVPGYFVAELSNHAVRHVTNEGIVQTVAGNGTVGDSGDNGPANQALLTAPSALAESRDGTLYIADAETNRIRKISCGDVDRCTSTADVNGSSCTWKSVLPALNDGNPCTADSCFWTVGAVHEPAGAISCSDGNPCNGAEVCSGTQCVAGTPLVPGTDCLDNNACNGDETCDGNHQCQAGPLPDLDDGNPCTVQSCSALAGIVTANVANGTACSANDPCQNPGTCSNGICATTAVALDSTNPCISETCSPTNGVVRTALNVSCPGGSCVAGACVPSGGIPAPALDNTVPPSSKDLLAAIYDPTTGVQVGAAVGTGSGMLNPDHAARLFGAVADATGAGLTDATVVVVDHPESGSTLTRADGKFDIVANGGGPLTVRFTKPGYLPVDRQVAPMWGGGAHVDDVVMLTIDPMATAIQINSATIQDAVGSVTTVAMDARGQRQARVVFPPSTTATAVSLDGTPTTLSALTVHATEFTVGDSEHAMARMPAPLPGSSLYTYAVDFSVDQAPDAASVTFSQPVFSYVDNFLGLPAGIPIPDGFYDRNKAAWVREDSGRVIDVVGYNAGGAIIDVTGDHVEDSLDAAVWNATPANERITAAERTLIASRYPSATGSSPKSLWRVPLTHFSYHDFNHGGGVACAGNPLKCPDFAGQISGGADAPKDGSCQRGGSIIGVEDQSLGEALPVMGTPYSLNYKSSYTLGYLPSHGAEVDFVFGPTVLRPVETRISLATTSGGWKAIRPAGAQNFIAWDGLDSSGRRVNGSQLATITATSVYAADYKVTGNFGDASDSDQIGAGIPVSSGQQPEVYFTRTFDKIVSAWGADTLGLGGWMLSPMHVYDPTSGVLYQGDGHQRQLKDASSIRLVAGDGTTTPAAQGTAALNSGFAYLSPGAFHSVAAAPNGDVFYWSELSGTLGPRLLRRIDALDQKVYDIGTFADPIDQMAPSSDGKYLFVAAGHRVLRITIQDGTALTVAGTGAQNNSRIDGPGNQATFASAQGIAMSRDGTLYVSDGIFVRKIATDDAHTVSTIAGNAGSSGGDFSCPSGAGPSIGKAAKSVAFSGPLALAVAADGAVWGGYYDVLARIDPSGTIKCFNPPGTTIGAVTIGLDQTVYFALQENSAPGNATIRKLLPDGTSTVVAGLVGQGITDPILDGTPAVSAKLATIKGLAAGPDGSLYFSNTTSAAGRIYRMAPPVNIGTGACAIALPSEDGTQTFCFDPTGRHQSTRNAVTGATLLTFNYTNNLLSSIADADGNTTTIDTSSNPVVITGPFGQQTEIGLDATTKYATYIQDATDKQTRVAHDANGLLLSMTDRNGHQYTFSYDGLGRLKRDADPANGYQILSRNPLTSGYSVSDVTATGATTSYSVTVDAQGNQNRSVSMPDGSQNRSSLDATNSSVTTYADGTSETDTTEPDKVWPSYQPYVTKAVTTLPANSLVRTVTRSKSVSYQATTPPAINTIVESTTVNSNAPLVSSFDATSKTYTVTTPGGRVGTISVDDFGRPVTVTAPGVDSTTYHYDHGRLSSVVQGARETDMTFYPTGGQTPGYLETVTAGNATASAKTFFFRDNAGRSLYTLTGTTALSSPTVETDLRWDDESNLSSVQNDVFMGVQTYTPVNLLETYQPSASPQTTTTFSYNKDRSLEFIRQPGGLGIDYVYDTSTHQLVSIVASGVQDATFGYYNSSTCAGCANGQLQTALRGVTTVTLAYNGPLTTSETWSGSGADALNGSVSWGYNSDLRATTETVSPAPTAPGAATVSYGYDPDGMVNCASLSTCADGAVNKLSLTYSSTTGALTDTALGVTAEHFVPNEYGELGTYSVKFSGSAARASVRSFDALGRVRYEAENLSGGAAATHRSFEYDDQGRLWRVKVGVPVVNLYSYDSRGNRLSVDSSGTTIASYDNQDELLSYAGTTYTYWPNGERRRRVRPDLSTDQYAYDTLGNLSEVATPYVTVDYVVDALNRRIVKKKNGTPSARYLYGSNSKIAAVLDGNGNLAARFVYASHPNTPDFMVLADGSVYRFLCDQLGSPRLIVNSTTGAIAQKVSYDPFGVAAIDTDGPFPAWQQPFGFAGGLYDEDTGLVRFGARDYDPEVGRWLARDPILFKGGQSNLYVYAGDDPVNKVDPTGRYAWIIVGAVAGGGFDLASQLYGNGGDFGSVDWDEVGTWTAGGALLPGAGLEWVFGSAFSATATSGSLVAVTQWGPSSSPWVMLGGNTLRNYLLSGVSELGYARDDAMTFFVEEGQLSYPSGVEAFKGTLGQRICK